MLLQQQTVKSLIIRSQRQRVTCRLKKLLTELNSCELPPTPSFLHSSREKLNLLLSCFFESVSPGSPGLSFFLNLSRMASIRRYSASERVFDATWKLSSCRMNNQSCLLGSLESIADCEAAIRFSLLPGLAVFLNFSRVRLWAVSRSRLMDLLLNSRWSSQGSLGRVGGVASGRLVQAGSAWYLKVWLAVTPMSSASDDWQQQRQSLLLMRTLPSPTMSFWQGFPLHCTNTLPRLIMASSIPAGTSIPLLKEKSSCRKMKGSCVLTWNTSQLPATASPTRPSRSQKCCSTSSSALTNQAAVSGRARQLWAQKTTWQGWVASTTLSLLEARHCLFLGRLSILWMACSISIRLVVLAYLHSSTRILPRMRMYTPSRSRCAWLKCSRRRQLSSTCGLSKKSARLREWESRASRAAAGSAMSLHASSLQDIFLKRWSRASCAWQFVFAFEILLFIRLQRMEMQSRPRSRKMRARGDPQEGRRCEIAKLKPSFNELADEEIQQNNDGPRSTCG